MPLRKRISDENVLRYNGMLISVFELLADARQQVGASTRTSKRCAISGSPKQLELALTGRSPGAMRSGRTVSRARAADAAH